MKRAAQADVGGSGVLRSHLVKAISRSAAVSRVRKQRQWVATPGLTTGVRPPQLGLDVVGKPKDSFNTVAEGFRPRFSQAKACS